MNRKKINISDLEISYLEKNENQTQTILCLHALGHSSSDYNKLFLDERFNDFRILALDFPNHGNSSNGNKNVSTKYYADITEEFINVLNLQNIILLGNSIGGGVSIRLASNKKNRIQLLQLANSAGLDKRGLLGKIFINFMILCFKTGVKKKKYFPKLFSYYYNNVLSEKEAEKRKNEIISKSFDIAPLLVEGWKSFSLESEDLRNIASDIDCPTLVTYAMKDKKVQYNRNIDGIKRIKNLKLLKYQVGHTPILENSKQFLDDLLLFIKQGKNTTYNKSYN